MQRLAAASWVGAGVCIVATVIAWRASPAAWPHRVWPHAGWVLAAIGLVFGPLLLAAWFSARRLWARPQQGVPRRRLAGVGWLLVAATPITWVASYYTHLYVQALSRASLVFNAPLRIAAVGALPYLDLEARLRYRRTEGRHVVLYDNGAVEDPQSLALEMDQHLTAMARRLGRNVPPGGITWVRGPLLGATGRAFLTTCVADLEDGSGNLTPLDRHESAHSLIASLGGPDHDPPMLLVEGWAEYHSTDRDESIRRLADRLRDEEIYSLQELVEPHWYGRSWGPVYWEGGPFAHYLIERFGASRFFELYTRTRRATFCDDAASILGEPWDETNEAFWRWVETEAALSASHSTDRQAIDGRGEDAAVELAQGVDPAEWEELLKALRAALPDPPSPPQGGFRLETLHERTNADGEPITQRRQVRISTTDEGTWVVERLDYLDRDRADDTFVMLTMESAAHLRRSRGVTRGSAGDFAARRDAVETLRRFEFRATPSFPWQASRADAGDWRLESLSKPRPGNDAPWVLDFTVSRRQDESNGDARSPIHYELLPRYGWSVVRMAGQGSGGAKWSSSAELDAIGERDDGDGGTVLPIKSVYTLESDDGDIQYTTTIQTLSRTAQEQVRSEVEEAVRRGVTPKYLAWRRAAPLAATGVPLCAAAFFAAGASTARRRTSR